MQKEFKFKRIDFSEDFGVLKGTKMTGQEFKDFVKKGWEPRKKPWLTHKIKNK